MSRVITFLAKQTGLRESDVRSIILRAPRSYKFYSIPKRSGGQRQIAQPAREVKALQRLFVRGLERLPIHESATAYRRGVSIKENALRHADSGPITKFDFKDFFPSIRSHDWVRYCEDNKVFEDAVDIEISTLLLFHRARKASEALTLAIGAPSSPWLSNVLMYDFDRMLSEEVKRDKIIYTRYADDLTFSAPRTGHLTRVEPALLRAIGDTQYPNLRINAAKSVTATPKYRRVVTGLVLALDGKVTVGRERKRQIRSMLHHASLGHLDTEEIEKLKGLVAFAYDIEPEYFRNAVEKLGDALPQSIRSIVL